MAKVIRPFSHIKVKTLANRVRPATVLAVDETSLTARIGTATNGTEITAIQDTNRPGRFIEGQGGPVLPHIYTNATTLTDGIWYYTTFTATDIFTVSGSALSDVFVKQVAGGGGGGNGGGYESGGGGGGGGVVYSPLDPLLTIEPNDYLVVVGAGGAFGTNGGDSFITPSIGIPASIGGGYGGPYGGGNNGGSGGGAPGWGARFQIGFGVSNQGKNGGYGTYNYSQSASGGGGGAGADGENGSWKSGNGGSGIGTNPLLVPNGVGENINGTIYLGAGGGGGSGWYNSIPAGSGGLGKGGYGGYWDPTSGATNSGSGGGGSNNDHAYAGNGGSGVVVIRYPVSSVSGIN